MENKMNTLTDFQVRILTIIDQHPNIRARQLSKLLWPDSEAHKRLYKGGYGTATGKGAWLAAGSQVGKLINKGLVKIAYDGRGNRDGYRITIEGARLLTETASVSAE